MGMMCIQATECAKSQSESPFSQPFSLSFIVRITSPSHSADTPLHHVKVEAACYMKHLTVKTGSTGKTHKACYAAHLSRRGIKADWRVIAEVASEVLWLISRAVQVQRPQSTDAW